MPASELRVGIIGAGYIAGVHSAAYLAVPGTFPEGPRSLTLAAVADTAPGRADDLQRRWRWERVEPDWQRITRADDINIVDICVPNAHHAPIAIDALNHGKHVVCEKPLAHNVADAEAMFEAAATSTRVAQVCFYYRLWPAVRLARQLIRDGEIGTVRHFRGWMLQDYAAGPGHQLGWRADRDAAGAGALGDLGSHIIDIARDLCGDIAAVNAITRHPVASSATATPLDEATAMLVEFASGATGVIEAGWAMRGHKADLGFDVVGSGGAIRFGWERSNELEVLLAADADANSHAAGQRILIGPEHGDAARFAGVPGQGLGYRDAFTIGIGRAVGAIARGDSTAAPSFEDGLQAARAVAAAVQSAATRCWISVEAPAHTRR
jgi:predicted dehydrogenase